MVGIYIAGPQCSGKSSTGKVLAGTLDVSFIDADRRLEGFYRHFWSTGIVGYSRLFGERMFRADEAIMVDVVTRDNSNIVFALGGGAIAHNFPEYRNPNVETLLTWGYGVYLKHTDDFEESAKVLLERKNRDVISKDSRLALGKGNTELESMVQLLEERDPLYKSGTGLIIYTKDKTQQRVAGEIIQRLELECAA